MTLISASQDLEAGYGYLNSLMECFYAIRPAEVWRIGWEVSIDSSCGGYINLIWVHHLQQEIKPGRNAELTIGSAVHCGNNNEAQLYIKKSVWNQNKGNQNTWEFNLR